MVALLLGISMADGRVNERVDTEGGGREVRFSSTGRPSAQHRRLVLATPTPGTAPSSIGGSRSMRSSPFSRR